MMQVNGRPQRTIWSDETNDAVHVLDQTRLPHEFVTLALNSREEVARAIQTMIVRGAPLIGVTGAYGMALAMREDSSNEGVREAVAALDATRPTAICAGNLP